MALDLRLEAKLSQSLVMTPRLQQAIKLLQYNHMEMVAHVQEAMLENPTLEEVPDTASAGEDGMDRFREKAEQTSQDLAEQSNGEEREIDWEKFLANMDDGPRGPSGVSGGTIHDELPPIETNLTYGESLTDHLMFQLKMLKAGSDEMRAAEVIVQNLDHQGYLVLTLEQVCEASAVDPEVAQDALEIVQGLDPIGCGARDLGECLVVQARVVFPEDPTFELILRDHLPHLERRNYTAIARALDLDEVDVIEYHKMIRDLEPRPGRSFSQEEPRYITPDIYVVRKGEEWVVALNEDGMPDLKISRYYQKIMRNASKQDKEYLLDKLRGAEFLIKSINKRRKTIRRVMESILKFQRDFFDVGVSGLRPMVLQDVADDVGVHMSTVSRVTTNKYVHTAHGTYELMYFFSAAVRQDSGLDMAAEAIKSRIAKLVSEENPKKPLSDQKLANLLKSDGVSVARRTVAKYREALGILPSSRRKKVF